MPLLKHVHEVPGFFPNLPLAPITIVVDAGESGVYGIRLEITGADADWEQIKSQGLFHYSPEICGPIFGGAFNPTRPHTFTVELVAEHVMTVAILSPTPAEAWQVLAEAEPDSPLRSTQSWRLLSVMQQRTPRTQWGLTTTFFGEQL